MADLDIASLSVGFIGQRHVSGPNWEVFPRQLPSVLVQLGRTFGSVRPGFTVSVPLEEQPWFVPDAVTGFSLDVALR